CQPHVRSSAFFFFQAEDGIRDRNVTGVQTCALPISCPFSVKTYFSLSIKKLFFVSTFTYPASSNTSHDLLIAFFSQRMNAFLFFLPHSANIFSFKTSLESAFLSII